MGKCHSSNDDSDKKIDDAFAAAAAAAADNGGNECRYEHLNAVEEETHDDGNNAVLVGDAGGLCTLNEENGRDGYCHDHAEMDSSVHLTCGDDG